MSSHFNFSQLNSNREDERSTGSMDKKAWSAPQLDKFGDIAKITQGGPPGSGDSGAGSLTENPNFS